MAVVGLLVLLSGCQSFTPRPLSREAVDAALAPPSMPSVAEAYQSRPHPLLPPVLIDAGDGIDPTEAACLAVILNPDLRAERASRGVVTAQLVQAGLLPNPQLIALLDWPSGGMTAGAIPAYGFGLGWDINALIEHSANLEAARADDRSAVLDLLWKEWQVACAVRVSPSPRPPGKLRCAAR